MLWLSENGVADHKLYRNLCIRLLPSLIKLDSIEVTPAERAAAIKDPEVESFIEASRRPPSASAAASTASAQPPARQATPPRPPAAPGARAGSSAVPSGRKKNILYAVMALVGELDLDDLVYVKREIEQRLGSEQPLV